MFSGRQGGKRDFFLWVLKIGPETEADRDVADPLSDTQNWGAFLCKHPWLRTRLVQTRGCHYIFGTLTRSKAPTNGMRGPEFGRFLSCRTLKCRFHAGRFDVFHRCTPGVGWEPHAKASHSCPSFFLQESKQIANKHICFGIFQLIPQTAKTP